MLWMMLNCYPDYCQSSILLYFKKDSALETKTVYMCMENWIICKLCECLQKKAHRDNYTDTQIYQVWFQNGSDVTPCITRVPEATNQKGTKLIMVVWFLYISKMHLQQNNTWNRQSKTWKLNIELCMFKRLVDCKYDYELHLSRIVVPPTGHFLCNAAENRQGIFQETPAKVYKGACR